MGMWVANYYIRYNIRITILCTHMIIWNPPSPSVRARQRKRTENRHNTSNSPQSPLRLVHILGPTNLSCVLNLIFETVLVFTAISS